MAKKHTQKTGRTLEQREAYHQEALKKLQVRKQIAALQQSLKKK